MARLCHFKAAGLFLLGQGFLRGGRLFTFYFGEENK